MNELEIRTELQKIIDKIDSDLDEMAEDLQKKDRKLEIEKDDFIDREIEEKVYGGGSKNVD